MLQKEEAGQTESLLCPRSGRADIWAAINLMTMLLPHTLLHQEKHIFKISEASQVKEKPHNPFRWESRNLHSITVSKVGLYSPEKELKWQSQEWDSPCKSSYSPGPYVIHINKWHFIFSKYFWRARDKWHSVWNQYLWEEARDAWWTLCCSLKPNLNDSCTR